MKLRLVVLGMAVAASSAAFAAPSAPRGFTVEDLVNLERVGSPAVSPDATRVVYTVRRTDIGKNRGHTSLWIADLRGKAAPKALVTMTAAVPIRNGRLRATPCISCRAARAAPRCGASPPAASRSR
jgi:hypothetical protein